MMLWHRRLVGLFLLPFLTAAAPGQSLTLDEILTRMDQAGDRLRSLSASITQRKWIDLLEEFDRDESGRFFFLREGQEVYLRKDIAQPQENSLVIAGGSVSFYQPRTKQLQRWALGQSQDRAEFLLLGFGSDKESMNEAYKIRLRGQETVRERRSYVLELTPKSESVSAYFSMIVLWVDPELWVPIRQKLVEPTRDYLLFEFTDVEINPRLNPSAFELKVPRDVQVIGR